MLTDTEIRKAKSTEKPQKISDGGGLFLLVIISFQRVCFSPNRMAETAELLEVPLREVLRLSFSAGLSIRKISASTKISVGSIQNIFKQAEQHRLATAG